VFKGDVRQLGAVADTYQRGVPAAQVVRGDDPRLVGSGVAGRAPQPGLVILFSRASIVSGVPQAVFLQTLSPRALLADIAPDAETRLALIAPDGSVDGDVADDTHAWLKVRHPVPGLTPDAPPIAEIVMARRADVGLASLFPHARLVLATLAAIAVVTLAFALWRLKTA
jgi:hypothetical protein